MKHKFVSMIILATLLLFSANCSTTIRAYKVSPDVKDRKNGIPFFLPKPALKVNEVVEIKRTEDIYALVSLNDLQLFLFKIELDNFSNSLEKLAKLQGDPQGTAYNLIPVPEIPFFQSKNIENSDLSDTATTTGNVTNSKTNKVDRTQEYTAIPNKNAPTDTVLYQTKDASKSVEVVMVPDYSKEYELIINPSKFASTKISVKLADGWKLSEIGTETGDNQLISSLTDIAKSVLSAQTEIKKAALSKDQAIEVARIGAAKDDKAKEMTTKPLVLVKIKAFVKQINTEVINPGLYDISTLTKEGKLEIPTNKATYWTNINF